MFYKCFAINTLCCIIFYPHYLLVTSLRDLPIKLFPVFTYNLEIKKKTKTSSGSIILHTYLDKKKIKDHL